MPRSTTTTNQELAASLQLAHWACGLRNEDLGDDAVDSAQLFVLDSVACALGGLQQHDVRLLLDHVRELGGHAQCSVLGTTLRCDPVRAAWIQAQAIRTLDFNDIYWKADPVHPSDLIPAALTPCELVGGSGRDLIRGVLIAYEIEMRLAEMASPGIREKGLHHATLSAFAAPVAAAVMLGLPPQQVQHAIGISGAPSLCLGAVTAGALSHMKNSVDPLATRSGVEAALLARRGFTGPGHVLDGKEGLASCLAPLGIHLDLEHLLRDLPRGPSDRWRILDCGMKSFPIEALMHAPVTALLGVQAEHAIPVDQVREIQVEVIARAADILGDPAKRRPTTRETADHSLPYCLAVALVDGEVTPRQFETARILDPSLAAVMNRVRVLPNQEFEALFPESQPSRVTLVLRDGSTRSRRVDVPRGHPRDPMGVHDLTSKLVALCRGLLDEKRCLALRQQILTLHSAPSVQSLFEACLPTPDAS